MEEGMGDIFLFAFEKKQNKNQVLYLIDTTWKQMKQILWNSQLLAVILGYEIWYRGSSVDKFITSIMEHIQSLELWKESFSHSLSLLYAKTHFCAFLGIQIKSR